MEDLPFREPSPASSAAASSLAHRGVGGRRPRAPPLRPLLRHAGCVPPLRLCGFVPLLPFVTGVEPSPTRCGGGRRRRDHGREGARTGLGERGGERTGGGSRGGEDGSQAENGLGGREEARGPAAVSGAERMDPRRREMAVVAGSARGEAGTRGAGWSETGEATITFLFFLVVGFCLTRSSSPVTFVVSAVP
jgi:hypothetical protein